MKFAVEVMQRRKSEEITGSFFINGRGVLLQKTPLGVYRALLSSLLRFFPDYLSELTKRFNDQEERYGSYERRNGWVWTEPELEEFLLKVLTQGTKAQPVTIFVDALDECGEDNAKRLLSYFSSIMTDVKQEHGSLKICFSSRHYPILGMETMPTLLAEERNDRDIRLVVQNRLKHLKSYHKLRQIENEILLKAHGGFQWAMLTTKIICDGVLRRENTESLQKAVTTIPEQLQGLYELILSETTDQERAHMVKLFQWVLFSERPLSAHELREALISSQDSNSKTVAQLRNHINYSDTVSDFEIRVRHISRGLVEFQTREVWEIYQTDGEDWDREAQFIHQSAADYVMQKFLSHDDDRAGNHFLTEVCHFEISRSCLKYMTMEDVLKSSHLSRRELSTKFPLFPYGVTFLLRHIKGVEQSSLPQTDLLDLILWYRPDAFKMFAALWRVMDPEWSHAPLGWPFVGATALHVLVGFGSYSFLHTYLTNNTVDFDVRDANGNTPLHLALRENREDMALLLLKRSTTLQAEYEHSLLGQEAFDAKQLAERVNFLSHINRANNDDETPLSIAVSVKAHQAILSLLSAGADATAEKGLLFYAIDKADRSLLADLLAKKVWLDGAAFFAVQCMRFSRQIDNLPAIHEILADLLDAGANTRRVSGVAHEHGLIHDSDDESDDEDDEAIFNAIRHGLTSVVELLVANSSAAALRNLDGDCPLQLALNYEDVETAKVLLQALPEAADFKDRHGETVLYQALRGDYEIAICFLETLFTDTLEAVGEFIKNGDLETVGEILTLTEDPTVLKHSTLKPPLLLAMRRDAYEYAEALLQTKVIDLNHKCYDDTTPLRWCLYNGKRKFVKLILDIGRVDIHEQDLEQTPFWWAMWRGSDSMVELLLSLDKHNIHRKNTTGETAFWTVVERGLTKTVRTILGWGSIDVNTRHRWGQTAIAQAAFHGHVDIFRLLFEYSSTDMTVVDDRGCTLLTLAAQGGNEIIIELLLGLGVLNLHAKDHIGRTPIFWAALNSHYSACQLLLKAGSDSSCATDSLGVTHPWIAGIQITEIEKS